MEIAEMFSPENKSLISLIKQCGVNKAVGIMDENNGKETNQKPWSYLSLLRLKSAYEDNGFQLEVLESRPPMNKIKLGLPGRDEQIDNVSELITNMGKLGIPVWCYEWMPVYNWLRTSTTIKTRGGAITSGYDHEYMVNAPQTEYGIVTEDELWENLEYFLRFIIPVAEKANVKLAMHPDDPPISPIMGLGRIMKSVEAFKQLVEMYPSPFNGITLCQGNFTMMTDNLPDVIRYFGQRKKIFFVHFRDVNGSPRKFVETFHDEGKTDMFQCMKAYEEIEYTGVYRPDHVPTIAGDTNEKPGYSSIGRLFAIGYLKGLHEAVLKTHQK